jgi:Chaperone of endosialidase
MCAFAARDHRPRLQLTPGFRSRRAGKLFAKLQVMKTTIQLLTTFLAFLCLSAVSPKADAVLPPPDGGYPNFNTAEGQNALFSLTTGTGNTAAGWYSLFSATTASFNTGVGAGTLVLNSGDQNTATGVAALLLNTTGFSNTATGGQALLNNTSGDHNTAAGFQTLFSNSTGDFNTASGDSALFSNTTGIGNTALGFAAGFNVTTANNVIAIANPGANVSNSCFIGNIYGVTTAQNNAIPVLIDAAGQLGTTSSSRRFKKEIKSMDRASEAILALKPVTFQYKSDSTNRPEFGLIAEEVAEVNPDLVIRNENGEIYTVRYEAVNAMLLNEFLKEHRKVEKLEATVADLAEQLQKITAQVQMKNSSARVAGK